MNSGEWYQLTITDEKIKKKKTYFGGGTFKQCQELAKLYKLTHYDIEKVKPITILSQQ